MAHSAYRVQALVRDIRMRWRRRALLQGAALSLGALALWGIGLLLAHLAIGLSSAVLIWGALLGGVGFGVLLVLFVLRPALRPISDRDVALFIEEQIPELEDRLNSAVEIDDPESARRAHGVLIDRLIDDASERARAIPLTTVIDRHKERVLTAASSGALLVLLVLGLSSINDLRQVFSMADLAAAALPGRPEISIDPGDAEIEQGASQEIIASLRDETDGDVWLHHRSGTGSWQKVAMQAGIDRQDFLSELVNVQEPVQYFVEHEQRRSGVFSISLYSFPAVEQIDLTYTYPAYTGRAPQTEVNSGDIVGLKGSVVRVDVHTSGTVADAELVVDEDQRIPLESEGDGLFRGHVTLENPGYYTVRLVDREEKQNKFPEEYRIEPIDDQEPVISITEPLRDVRANAVEEVFIAVEAQDDFGIEDMRLKFAINGQAEQEISLADSIRNRPVEVSGDHVFFLEDYALEPGDVISYFVEAKDGYHEVPEATDMYFIEVIPFDQEYSQAGAGAGMGGGGPSGIVLNQQQIIAATWKLHRERVDMSGGDYESSRQGLVQAQGNLQTNIEQRINATAFSLELQRSEDNRKIAEYLRAAVRAMQAAVVELQADRLREALAPEREALNQLLKADALNRERQITLSRGQQGGGSASATEERMTELMDLELDISKDKYEVLQNSPTSSGGQAMDETLQKLRELARRQQNLANESGRALEGEDLRRQVERLQRDQDQLREQTESLSRSMRRERRSDETGGDVQEQMERVVKRMEEAEQALREGDVQRAQARQQQAINDLERLTENMRMATGSDQRAASEAIDRQFEKMREMERQLAEDLQRSAGSSQNGGMVPDRSDLERLLEERRSAREELDRIEQQAETLAGRSSTDRDLASAARNLQRAIEREGLKDQMLDSERAIERGWLDHAARRQEAIERSISRLEEEVREFEAGTPIPDQERMAQSLETLRRLEQELQGLANAASSEQSGGEQEGEGSGESQGNNPQSESPGSSGQQGARAERADAARRQARLERARGQLDQLSRDLEGSPAVSALNQVRRALGRADHAGVSLEGESAKAFFNDEVFAPLSQVEAAIARELDQIALDKKLYGSRPGDIPAEYRDLVEKYYESLSKADRR